MILLRTLGSCGLIAPDQPGTASVLAQPKRFALLTYLAVAKPGEFVRRDTLLTLFWPETDQEHGRQVLRQTVYLLRQALGADVITKRGAEELGIDPAVLKCDVTLFEAAMAGRRATEAMQHYRGDFLSGFHVPDAAPELAEWIDAQRRRLRALATSAAWTLAVADERDGNYVGASNWARRALELDPFNEHRVGDVMQLLARAGDRAGALGVYADFVRRAAEDLGMEPGERLRKQADALRTAPDLPGNGDTSQLPQSSSAARSSQRLPASMVPADKFKRRLTRTLIWATPALALLALGTILLHGFRSSEGPPVVAVGPIVDASGNESGRTSSLSSDLLSTSLARLTGVRVIPISRINEVQQQLRTNSRSLPSVLEAARHLGAQQLIQGTLHTADHNGVQLDLQMVDLRSGAIARGYRVRSSDVFGAVDQTTALIASAYGVAAPPDRIADLTTSSLPAYRLYEQGLQAYYAMDWASAYRLFRSSLAEDTSFAMAAYYAGFTAQLADPPASLRLLLQASRLADHATDRERLRIVEGVASLTMSAASNAFADTMAARYPLDPDAQLAAGKAAMRRGLFMEAAQRYRRVVGMDSLALNTPNGRCPACDAYEQLWWAYLFADSAAAAARVAREFSHVRPGLGNAFPFTAMALARLGRTAEAWAAWRAQDSLRGGSVNLDRAAANLAMRDADFAPADDRLQRLMREGSPTVRDDAGWLLAISLRAQGRRREALQLVEAHLPESILKPILLFEIGQPSQAATIFERDARKGASLPSPGHRARHYSWLFTHLATSLAAAGDTTRLTVIADSVQYWGSQSAYGRDPRLHHYVRGLLWKARGDRDRAAQSFRESVWSWSEGYTRANYELARILVDLKRADEALYPLQSALRGDLESSNLYVTRTELHELLGQVFDELQMPDSAAVHYQHVITAWRNADPEFVQRRQSAARRLEAIGLLRSRREATHQ